MNDVKPNLFIVGQPKSGTSAIYSFLRQHPEICMGSMKEPQYFCRDFQSQYFHLSKLERDEKNYLALFPHCSAKKVIGEASTAYLYSKVAANEIAKFNPTAKIIAVLREPVDFLFSYHLQLQRNSCVFETEEDFVTALNLEDARKAGKSIPKNCLEPQFLFYSDRVKYVEQLQRLYKAFPKEQVKVIIFDDFKADNAGVYREVTEFLGVSQDFQPDMAMINTKVKVRNRRLKQAADRFLFPIKQRIRNIIPSGYYKSLRSIYRSLVLSKDPIKPLPDDIRLSLKERYRSEVVELSALLDRDLLTLWDYK